MQHHVSSLERVAIDWHDLQLFHMVVRLGGFRRAARESGVSAATLSRRTSALEQSLGVSLFARSGDRVQLTANGYLLSSICDDMEASSRRLDAITDRNLSEPGAIRCAVTEGLATYWLMPRLADYQAANPSTSINLLCTMMNTDVLRLEADLAIQFVRPENPDLISFRLATIHTTLFASQNYIRKRGTPRRLDDMVAHVLVDQESPQTPAGILAHMLGAHFTRDGVVFKTNTSSAHYYAIHTGIGIGLLPTYAVPLGAEVTHVDLGVHRSDDLWITYHPAFKDSPRMKSFIAWLKGLFDPARHPYFRSEYIAPEHLLKPCSDVMPVANAVTHPPRWSPHDQV